MHVAAKTRNRHTHTHAGQPQYSNDNNNYYKLFEALKLIRIKYILYLCKIAHALRVSKHVTESIRNIARGVYRHQLKMAAPAEVSEKRSNFRIRQF